MWSRILAGEVAQPGSFSLRTLNVVKALSKADADRFVRLCSTIWATYDEVLLPLIFDTGTLLQYTQIRLGFEDLGRVEEAGLIKREFPGVQMNFDKPDVHLYLSYFGKAIVAGKTNNPKLALNYGLVSLTSPGQELAKIATAVPDEDFRLASIEKIRSHGWSVVDFNPAIHGTPPPRA
ncbi:DUF2806 domain-containing protein [Limnoglobus roseus]|uniref:DUF2806 domain-containing protein n=1 Tax=Limnoglobus roseus TaxID=2598579 RepID=UPI001FEC92EB|nr:DUF2806 domain-containing protein [Limnoglobus roseus]